jgi:NAD(P)-dependent dehydrogenase (short-subunit alcohol dehydrogenase family)
MSLAGKVALVTGGGRGIGAAIARGLGQAGAHVVVAGRTGAEIDAVAREIGGRAMRFDICDRSATDAALAAIAREVGPFTILVNNAGAAESAPFARHDDALWDRMLELNATAPFRLARALVPGMVAAKWGRVVNVASNAGVTGYRYTVGYCAAKHAVVGMTRALAAEVAASGVTVNAICPGWVATRLTEEAIARIGARTGRTMESARDELAAMSPQRRMLEPDEVAALALYLCRDEARGVNGQALVIDGGQVLG